MDQCHRDYFRIDTEVHLAWTKVSSGDDSQSKLGEIDQQLQAALSYLQLRDADGARVLALLSRKVDAIYAELNGSSSSAKWLPVNISGSGIAFPLTEALAADTALAISLELPDTGVTVRVKATVISCAPVERGFSCRCRFDEDQEVVTDQIVAFVNREQMAQLSARGGAIGGY